ncbi:hypothetical protein MVES1_000326 [Malassezia vespertilionis]|uniref:uncharacterized protein n=1 Tax=Malassezia vespertilionis TaxID=2020962 RepID=UPI0024B0F5C0|nr:uncharacterized protein MVES1_000326 [Malassezia vespertilionis]WFD05001.1 hypothetical protein MVES1_000326 [Malassezia vespertilionis]
MPVGSSGVHDWIAVGVLPIRVDPPSPFNVETSLGSTFLLDESLRDKLFASVQDATALTHLQVLDAEGAARVSVDSDFLYLWASGMHSGPLFLQVWAKRAGCESGAHNPAHRALWDALLKHIHTSPEQWHCECILHDTKNALFWNPPLTAWSLSELYRNLPSPPHATEEIDMMLSALPLKSTLLQHQKKSLAKMLQRERAPHVYCDPYYLERTSPNAAQYAFDAPQCRFLAMQDVHTYRDSKGGIVCDEMGSGKTFLCLCLILATRTDLAHPEQDPMASQVTTEIGLALPQSAYHGLDPAAARGRDRIVTAAFGAPSPGERISRATLLLVPLALLNQWVEQMDTHVEPSAWRVLVVSDMHTPLPNAHTLAQQYDIVLMSNTRFGKEATTDGQELRANLDESPVMQVCWKRVMVDEGEVLAGDSLMVRLCTQLRVERRWIITNTPIELLSGTGVHDKRGLPTVWSSAERKSLDKLRLLLVRFLRLEPFYSARGKARDWHTLIASGMDKKAHEWIAKRRLYDMLARVMVRNHPQDVEKVCRLPPLHRRTIKLSFSDVERTTYSVVEALQTLHAPLSPGDLALACFHLAGPGLVDEVERASNAAHAQQPSSPQFRALEQLSMALHDRAWRASMRCPDILYKVHSEDAVLSRAWSTDSAFTSEELLRLQHECMPLLDGKHTCDALRETLLTQSAAQPRAKRARYDTPVRVQSHGAQVQLPFGMDDVEIYRASSSKLNAVLSEIMEAVQNEKVLVFSSLDAALHELDAVLALAHIPHRCYLAGTPQKHRNAYVSAFMQSPHIRCLLLSTAVDVRGMDLHCASRIIFCEPIRHIEEWLMVKRAWRLGQTHPVLVSTYLMRRSIEENEEADAETPALVSAAPRAAEFTWRTNLFCAPTSSSVQG